MIETFQSQDISLLQVAVETGILTTADACRVAIAAEQRDMTALDVAVGAALMDSDDVEIISLLADGENVAPGYQIEDLIGRGGMGAVFRARQKTLKRTVALKLLANRGAFDSAAAARFEREATAIGRLRHPNIVTAYDFGRHNNRFFLAMEYVEGVDLENWIQKHGPLGEQLALEYVRQAASGLSHAAKQGVIHRDLKPANLLLVEPPEGFGQMPGTMMVKIADFGLAILNQQGDEGGRLTAANSMLGSPCYMAPEQFEGADLDVRTDIYGLGATLFHMLTGEPPYLSMKLPQMIQAKLNQAPPSVRQHRPELSMASERLVLDMMSSHPEERIGSYEELLDHLNDASCSTAPPRTTAAPPPVQQTRVMTTQSITPQEETASADTEAVIQAATQAAVHAASQVMHRRPTATQRLAPVVAALALVGLLVVTAMFLTARLELAKRDVAPQTVPSTAPASGAAIPPRSVRPGKGPPVSMRPPHLEEPAVHPPSRSIPTPESGPGPGPIPYTSLRLSGVEWPLLRPDLPHHWSGDRERFAIRTATNGLYVMQLNGLAQRKLHRAFPHEPVDAYVASMQVQLHKARQVEIAFAWDELVLRSIGGEARIGNMRLAELIDGSSGHPDDVPLPLAKAGEAPGNLVATRAAPVTHHHPSPMLRGKRAGFFTLQLSTRGVSVTKLGQEGRSSRVSSNSSRISSQAYQHIVLERHRSHWRVFMNGERLALVETNHGPPDPFMPPPRPHLPPRGFRGPPPRGPEHGMHGRPHHFHGRRR